MKNYQFVWVIDNIFSKFGKFLNTKVQYTQFMLQLEFYDYKVNFI